METVSQLIQRSASRLVTLNHYNKLNKLYVSEQQKNEDATSPLHSTGNIST